MPFYIVRQAPKDATLKDAADGLVINFPGSMMELAEAASGGSKWALGNILPDVIAVITQSCDASQFNFLEGVTFAIDAFDDDDFELLSEAAQLWCNDLIKRRKDSSVIAWPADCEVALTKRVPRPKVVMPKRKPSAKKPSNSMKGKLKPTADGKLPASVLVLRACRGRGLSATDLCALFETLSRTTVLSATYRMTEADYLQKGELGDLTTTEAGLAAIKEFDGSFPAHAEPKSDDNNQQPNQE